MRTPRFVAAVCMVALMTALALWIHAVSSSSVSNDGWTIQEKKASIEYLQKCPATECLAAYWHPELRSMIVEVRQGLPKGATVITPELAPFLNIQVLREGLLSTEAKKTFFSLPEQANDIPLIAPQEASPPLNEDDLLTRLHQCAPDAAGSGVNGYSITIFLRV